MPFVRHMHETVVKMKPRIWEQQGLWSELGVADAEQRFAKSKKK